MSCLTLSWNWWNFTWSATFWTRVLLVRFPNFPSWNLASYWITTAYRGSFRCWRTLVTYLVWPRSLECAIGASPHRFLHSQANRSLLLWFSALCLCSLQRAPLLLRENATLRGCARSCSPFLLLSPTQVCTTYPGFGVAGRYGCKSTNGPTVFFFSLFISSWTHAVQSGKVSLLFCLRGRTGWDNFSGGSTVHLAMPKYWLMSVWPGCEIISGWPTGYLPSLFTQGYNEVKS